HVRRNDRAAVGRGHPSGTRRTREGAARGRAGRQGHAPARRVPDRHRDVRRRLAMAGRSLTQALAGMMLVGGFAVPAGAQILDDRTPAVDDHWPAVTTVAAPQTGWSAPALHVSLAAGFASLQALDTITTLHSVHGGTAVEANPLMGGLAQHA